MGSKMVFQFLSTWLTVKMAEASKLRELFKNNSLAAFKKMYKSYEQGKKDSVFGDYVYSSNDGDEDLRAVQLLLKLGGKPTGYFCKAHIQFSAKRYKILLLLMKNGLQFQKAYPLEQACRDNMSHEFMDQLVAAGGTFHPNCGSPLYFAVAQQHNELIKWLLEVKKCDIHSTPSSFYGFGSNTYGYGSKDGYPAIAACIEMLKARYRDWYVDRNPIDTTPVLRRWGLSFGMDQQTEQQEKTVVEPKYWDLEKDEEWIELCNLLKLLISYGANPFNNYIVKRRFGGQSHSPTHLLTFNICLWLKRCKLESIEKALIEGFHERIKRKAEIVANSIDGIDMNLCEIIGLYLIGEYYDQIEWKDSTVINDFKDVDMSIRTHSYNKAGDHFPNRTSGCHVKRDHPSGGMYASSFV